MIMEKFDHIMKDAINTCKSFDRNHLSSLHICSIITLLQEHCYQCPFHFTDGCVTRDSALQRLR
jgi:hypothetical protein